MENFEKLVSEQPLVKQMQRREEVFWANPQKTSFAESKEAKSEITNVVLGRCEK